MLSGGSASCYQKEGRASKEHHQAEPGDEGRLVTRKIGSAILKMLSQCLQTQDVAIGSKTTDLSNSNRSNVGMVTERFAAMDIAEMNFYGGQINSGDRISKGNTRMGIGSRIN